MRVFLVTGAGVSAESGLGTFRDKGGTGIWTRFDPMKLANARGVRPRSEKALAPILDIIRKYAVHASLEAVDASRECPA